MRRVVIAMALLLVGSACAGCVKKNRFRYRRFKVNKPTKQFIPSLESGRACTVRALRRHRARGANMAAARIKLIYKYRPYVRNPRITDKVYSGEPAFYIALRRCPSLVAAQFLWPYEVAATRRFAPNRPGALYLRKWPRRIRDNRHSHAVVRRAARSHLFMQYKRLADATPGAAAREVRNSLFATYATIAAERDYVVRSALWNYLKYCRETLATRRSCASQQGRAFLRAMVNVIDVVSRKTRSTSAFATRNQELSVLLAHALLVHPDLAAVPLDAETHFGGAIYIHSTPSLPPRWDRRTVAEIVELQRLSAPAHLAGKLAWLRDELTKRGNALRARGRELQKISREDGNRLVAQRQRSAAFIRKMVRDTYSGGMSATRRNAIRRCVNRNLPGHLCRKYPNMPTDWRARKAYVRRKEDQARHQAQAHRNYYNNLNRRRNARNNNGRRNRKGRKVESRGIKLPVGDTGKAGPSAKSTTGRADKSKTGRADKGKRRCRPKSCRTVLGMCGASRPVGALSIPREPPRTITKIYAAGSVSAGNRTWFASKAAAMSLVRSQIRNDANRACSGSRAQLKRIAWGHQDCKRSRDNKFLCRMDGVHVTCVRTVNNPAHQRWKRAKKRAISDHSADKRRAARHRQCQKRARKKVNQCKRQCR